MILSNDIWAAISAVQGNVIEPSATEGDLCPVSRDVQKAYAEAEEAKWRNMKAGDFIEGQGIFLCEYKPMDREGNWLGKIFKVFAAPQDLTDAAGIEVYLDYNEAVKYVAGLRNWHGFNGADVANDTALYDLLRGEGYKDEWVIPPRELLDGYDVSGYDLRIDNLFSCRVAGAFKNTFELQRDKVAYAVSDWYMSCTEDEGDSARIWQRAFSGSVYGPYHKDSCKLSCRLVRFVDVTP